MSTTSDLVIAALTGRCTRCDGSGFVRGVMRPTSYYKSGMVAAWQRERYICDTCKGMGKTPA